MGYGLSIAGGTTAVVGLGGLTGLAFYNDKWVQIPVCGGVATPTYVPWGVTSRSHDDAPLRAHVQRGICTHDKSQQTTMAALLGGGIALELVGLAMAIVGRGYKASANGHAVDAVNYYNDAVGSVGGSCDRPAAPADAPAKPVAAPLSSLPPPLAPRVNDPALR